MSDHTIALGEIHNTDGIYNISVQVDVDNDGTIDQTVPASFASVIQTYIWDVSTIGLGDPYEGFEIAFTAVGMTGGVGPLSGGMQQVKGNTVVVTIKLEPSNPPNLDYIEAMHGLFWGGMTDDSLDAGGEYTLEVSTTSATEGFSSTGMDLETDGTFFATPTWDFNGVAITIWVRMRETTDGFTLYSNVLRRDISAGDNTLPDSGGNGGNGDGGSGNGDGGSGDGDGDGGSGDGGSGDGGSGSGSGDGGGGNGGGGNGGGGNGGSGDGGGGNGGSGNGGSGNGGSGNGGSGNGGSGNGGSGNGGSGGGFGGGSYAGFGQGGGGVEGGGNMPGSYTLADRGIDDLFGLFGVETPGDDESLFGLLI